MVKFLGAIARTGTFALLLALAAALVAPVVSLALDFPALQGRVVDQAGILDETTRTVLARKLADLEAKTTDQLVVVTLRSLQGTSIEDFRVQLGRNWQIGQKDKNNGVLLIVVPDERKARIEVGYGLEGALTDAVGRLIIENAIFPRFRAGDLPGGITRGVDDIITVLTGDADDWKRRAAKRPDAPAWVWLAIGIVAFALIFLVPVLIMGRSLKSTRGYKPQSRHGRGDIPQGYHSAGSTTDWSSSSWSSSVGSSSSDGYSGGGGSFGGGGSSGSW